MIGYVTLGTNKFDESARFYDNGNKLSAFCMVGDGS